VLALPSAPAPWCLEGCSNPTAPSSDIVRITPGVRENALFNSAEIAPRPNRRALANAFRPWLWLTPTLRVRPFFFQCALRPSGRIANDDKNLSPAARPIPRSCPLVAIPFASAGMVPCSVVHSAEGEGRIETDARVGRQPWPEKRFCKGRPDVARRRFSRRVKGFSPRTPGIASRRGPSLI